MNKFPQEENWDNILERTIYFAVSSFKTDLPNIILYKFIGWIQVLVVYYPSYTLQLLIQSIQRLATAINLTIRSFHVSVIPIPIKIRFITLVKQMLTKL